MSKKTPRVVISAVVVVGALAGLFYATSSEGFAYYKHVEEVMTSPDVWYGKPLQLHGYVAEGSHLRKPNTLDHYFVIESAGHSVPAFYTGVVPDTFKSGSEVVIKGRLGPDGFQVEKNGIMAKCPSKYEAEAGAGRR